MATGRHEMVSLRCVITIRAGSVSAASEGSSQAPRIRRGVPSRMITASRYTSMKERRSASRLFQVLGVTTQISTRYRTKASRSCPGALVDRRQSSAAIDEAGEDGQFQEPQVVLVELVPR